MRAQPIYARKLAFLGLFRHGRAGAASQVRRCRRAPAHSIEASRAQPEPAARMRPMEDDADHHARQAYAPGRHASCRSASRQFASILSPMASPMRAYLLSLA